MVDMDRVDMDMEDMDMDTTKKMATKKITTKTTTTRTTITRTTITWTTITRTLTKRTTTMNTMTAKTAATGPVNGNWVRRAKCHWSSLSIDLGPKMFLNFHPNNGDLSQTFSDAFTSHLQWNKKLKL